MDVRVYYYLPNLLAAILTAMAAYYLWPKRSIRGAVNLLIMLIGSACWALCESFLYFDNSISDKICFTRLQYLGIATLPPNLFIFTWRYVGWDAWLNRRVVTLFNLASIIMLVLVWTNGWHGLVWKQMVQDDSGPFTMLALTHGPAFWAWIFFSHINIIVALVVLSKAYLVSSIIIRRQYRFMFIAFLTPFIANIVYLYKLLPVPNLDPTPISFCLAILLMGCCFIRYRMYDVMPIARYEVFMSLPDGIMVIDNHDRLAFINPAAETILGQSNDDVVGSELCNFIDRKILPDQTEQEHVTHEMEIAIKGKDKTFDLRFSRLSSTQKEHLGWLIVWRDISQRKTLENELRCLASTDSLTGAYNRRHFINKGRDEVERCLRYGKSMSVLMLDIDHFKKINDEFGHDVGDLTLQAFTRICKGGLRNFDTFGRLGGEEFAVLMPETDIHQAISIAERLRKAIMEMQVLAGKQAVTMTASIGIASLDDHNQDIESILKSADQALYQAKNSGRNRVAQAV